MHCHVDDIIGQQNRHLSSKWMSVFLLPKRTNRRKRRFVRFLIVTVFQESIQTLDGYRPAPVEKKRIFYTGTPFLPPTCQEK